MNREARKTRGPPGIAEGEVGPRGCHACRWPDLTSTATAPQASALSEQIGYQCDGCQGSTSISEEPQCGEMQRGDALAGRDTMLTVGSYAERKAPRWLKEATVGFFSQVIF